MIEEMVKRRRDNLNYSYSEIIKEMLLMSICSSSSEYCICFLMVIIISNNYEKYMIFLNLILSTNTIKTMIDQKQVIFLL